VQTKPVFKKAVAGGTTHTVSGGETLYSLGRTYGVSPFVIADANGLSHDQGLHIGQQIKIPGTAKARSQALAQNDAQDSGQIDNADADVTPIAKSPKKKAPLALTEEEQQQADAAAADDGADSIPAVPASKTKTAPFKKAETNQPMPQVPVADGSLNLRWPLRGKVISEFGPKANGLKNEGINIAVPEGTSVRAAEGGVVAYAGNELKGYGNLVLIRHTGGYVTAYAHAKELLVKRGDTVNKGDVIAKAGQTGAVSSPQLHFEVRKGATALDPLKFMTSATAMN
jgi:murein DD-endopeptidase MepM/ murein hydrolase activator NlpD